MRQKVTTLKVQNTAANSGPKYISPKELAIRWRCGRSSVDRYCKAEGLHKLMLGRGKNACVRYLLSEVEAMEQKRTVKSY